MARVFDQAHPFGHRRSQSRSLQGRRHRQGRCGLAARDDSGAACSDADIELVQVDPFSAGYFDREVEKGRRLVSAVSYWRKDIKDNGYAHPIEGVVALVDLIENRIVHLVDEPDIIPIPRKSRNYDRASIPQTRKRREAARCRAEGRPSFTVEGWKVALAELVVPRRLDRARGPRAAPDIIS
jgi:Cu2+-containing amine oxidase